MLHVAHLTVGQTSKGGARLWLQGRRLADCGATVGSRFTVQIDRDGHQLVIELRDGGDRTVSPKDRERTVPVIDIAGRTVSDVFPIGTRVHATFEPGRIIVRVHPRDGAAAERAERLARKLRNGEPLATGALCFGGGLLDAAIKEGLAASGIASRLAFVVEREERYLEHAMANNPAWRPDTVSVCADLADVDPEGLPEIDFLIAGIPCTAASRSGRAKQRSLDPTLRHPEGHPEGSLFVDLLRFVAACNPAVIVLENVPPYRDSAAYACVSVVLKKLGYDVRDAVLDAAEHGCNEERQRLCMVASTRGAICVDDLAPGLAPQPIADKLDPIPEEDERWRRHTHHQARQADGLEKGRNFKLQLVTPQDATVGTFGRGYSKDRMTEPHLIHPTDPTRSRLFTAAEHARFKGVPVALVAGLSHTVAHEILGQGVAFPPFVAVGRRIGEALRAIAETIRVGAAPLRMLRNAAPKPRGHQRSLPVPGQLLFDFVPNPRAA